MTYIANIPFDDIQSKIVVECLKSFDSKPSPCPCTSGPHVILRAMRHSSPRRHDAVTWHSSHAWNQGEGTNLEIQINAAFKQHNGKSRKAMSVMSSVIKVKQSLWKLKIFQYRYWMMLVGSMSHRPSLHRLPLLVEETCCKSTSPVSLG